MLKKKGTLIPIGGNEDKGIEDDEMYTLDFIDEGIVNLVSEFFDDWHLVVCGRATH